MRVSLSWLKDFVDVKGGLDKVQHSLTMTGLEVTSIIDVEGGSVMDIEITPNRPDCLSILGVSRELAAAMDKPLKMPLSVNKSYAKKGHANGAAKIEIEDKKGCSRYVGCVIKNVKVGPSPKWLVDQLNAMGVRSVNNIVDITNYVLFELGQPLHAFDMDKLEGKKIIVRRAKKGEAIVSIDGVRRDLDPDMLIIADAKRPVAIAGIMGGKDTEISSGTKNVLLESAYFDPVIIRKAQRKLGLASESSYRFERGVDFAMVLAASVRAQELIREIAGGRIKGAVTDVGARPVKEKEIRLSISQIPRVLGIEIGAQDVMSFLKRLCLRPVKKNKDTILVKVPPYRQDLNKDIDLIEELARLYGYDKIPAKMPLFTTQRDYEEEKKPQVSLEKEAKRILYSLGMNEVLTYTLTSRSNVEALGISFDGTVRLANPLSSNQEFMRPSLLSEMLEVINWNLSRNNSFLRLFELNKIYLKDKEKNQINEKESLAMGMCGMADGNWKEKPRGMDFFDLKGAVEFFLDSLGVKDYVIEEGGPFIFKEKLSSVIKVGHDILGVLGEVKPEVAKCFDIKDKVYLAEISVEELLKHANLNKRFTALPKYPAVKRDISLLVSDSVNNFNIFRVIKEVGGNLVTSVGVFDFYKGQQVPEGKKSLAYRVEYRSDERTLKDEEVSQIHKNIQEALTKKLGAQIR